MNGVLQRQNAALQQKATAIDSEILQKARAAKNARVKLIDRSLFDKRSKSNIKAQSNLFKERTFDPEPILREQTKECTFKPAINDTAMLRNYVPLMERTYPKKEPALTQDVDRTDLDQLVRQQGDKGRACLTGDEWAKKEKVVLSEHASVKSGEEEVKPRRNFNPQFYAEQFAWLKGIHKRIREEQLNRDQDRPESGKTKEVNQELLRANLAFFERLEKEKKGRKAKAAELEKEAYNFPFKPAINERSRQMREDSWKAATTPLSIDHSAARDAVQNGASKSPRPHSTEKEADRPKSQSKGGQSRRN